MPFGPASRLGVSLFDETPPMEWVPGRSGEEIESLINAVYRQVLGNAYVMESERLAVPESQFKMGDMSVREFVRAVAKSALYRDRFFTDVPRYRYIELAYRHLLGRAPNSYDDMKMHSNILDAEGYDADIDSFIDSDEYQNTFGENFVPFLRGWKTEALTHIVGFTHTFQLVRGASTSSLKADLSGTSPKLNALVINAQPTPVTSPGNTFSVPANTSYVRQGVGASDGGKVYRIEVTGYRAKAVNRVSQFRRSNQVYIVPYENLSQEYQRIHRQGGQIVSVTEL
jgi:phycoerythrin-associated linker protein